MAEMTTDYLQLSIKVADLEESSGPQVAARYAREIASAAQRAGDEGFARFFTGEACALEGDLEQGLRLQGEAVATLAEVPFVLINYATLLSMRGKIRTALGYLDRALQIEPQQRVALGQKGVCLAKLAYNQEALAVFDQVLALEPTNLHALRNKGVALSRLSREKEAMALFEKVLNLNPGDPHVLSEKKILEEELRLKGTPLGYLVILARKKVVPAWKRACHPLR